MSSVQLHATERSVQSLNSDMSWLPPEDGLTPATTNQQWSSIPFQRWFHFKEAFSPRFVAEVLAASHRKVRTCCDPFGGAGTTALTCQFLGVRPTTVEVNPFLADVIEAKLASYDPDGLVDARTRLARRFTRRASAANVKERSPLSWTPATFVEPGIKGRWIFDQAIAARVQLWLDAIDGESDPSVQRLFRVLLGGALVSVSNVVINGKGRRYRASSRLHQARWADVDSAFESKWQAALFDICRFCGRKEKGYHLVRGDSRTALHECDPVDLVLCSPPYPNSFDYTDIYNVELWALGYLRAPSANRVLREATIRSHVQIKRDFTYESVGNIPTLRRVVERLESRRELLWSTHLPAMIGAYFSDLALVLSQSREIVARNGQIVFVVGDSRYAGVMVDVAKILTEIAARVGLAVEASRPVRVMRASAQQGGRYALREHMLTLRRR